MELRSAILTHGWKTQMVQKQWYVMMSCRDMKLCLYQTLCTFSFLLTLLLYLRPLLKSRTSWPCRTWSSVLFGLSFTSGSLSSMTIPNIAAPTKEGRGTIKERTARTLENNYSYGRELELHFWRHKKFLQSLYFLFLFSGISIFTTKVSRTRTCCMCRTLWMNVPLCSLTQINSLKMALWHWRVSQTAQHLLLCLNTHTHR